MDKRIKYNMSQTRLYKSWSDMNHRCYSPRCKGYKTYRGRGYSPWRDFIPFMEWALSNGYRDNLTIDRIDNDKGYSPENCRWISMKDNVIKGNKEGAEKYYFKDKWLTVIEIADLLGVDISVRALRARLVAGTELDRPIGRYKGVR